MARDPELMSRIAPLALAYAQARGVDVKPLLEKHRLPADLNLAQPNRAEVVITASTLRALTDEVAALTGDASLGLTLATKAPRGLYGVTEFLVRAAPTVRQAADNLLRFSALVNPGLRFSLETKDGLALLEHGVPHSPGALGRHTDEFITAFLVTVLRTLVDLPRLAVVRFQHPRPADTSALGAFFGGAALEFEQELNGLGFDERVLDLPVKTGDAALFAYLEEHAVAALASRPKADDLVDKLRHAIRDALEGGEPNVERLAVRLNLSARTLQRRLSELGTTFQEVLDAVRYDLARAWLKDGKLDVTEVAYLLGYSELRAFDRAFKRWAGLAPREWRAKARG